MDLELVIGAQRGDHLAFAALVDAVGGRLLGTARAILRDASLAEDALQQALLSIWQDLPTLREPERFEAWAYRVLVNACHAEGRRARRWRLAAANGPVPRHAADEFSGVEDRDELERGFRRLTVDQRAAFVLHYHLSMTMAQVADVLDVPIETVRSRVRAAANGMRAAIDADSRATVTAVTPSEVVR